MTRKKKKDKPQSINEICLTCTKKCKQFANVEIVNCTKYEVKKRE